MDVVITVRDFELLDPLGAALATHEALNLQQVSWDVDWDNPARHAVAAAGFAARSGGSEAGSPSLDPVPQELTAIIEARLVADGVSLTAP